MTIILHKKAQKHTYHDKLQLTVKYSMEVMIFLTRKGPIWVFLPSCEIQHGGHDTTAFLGQEQRKLLQIVPTCTNSNTGSQCKLFQDKNHVFHTQIPLCNGQLAILQPSSCKQDQSDSYCLQERVPYNQHIKSTFPNPTSRIPTYSDVFSFCFSFLEVAKMQRFIADCSGNSIKELLT